VDFNIQAANMHIGVDIAIPCSLIINELVSNSFKHGFDDSMKPKLLIKFSKKKSIYELIVRDNGVGFPDSFFEKHTDSLGIMLVKTLAGQLGGDVEFKNVPGAEAIIKFEFE
jgi:two-component sensor histidine kinase